MPTLRINQHPGSGEDRYRIEVSAEGIPGIQPQSLSTVIEFALSPQDRERIRWYLEEFLEFDQEPSPQIAKRVEALMAERGEKLFRDIFQSSDDLRELWGAIRPRLSDTRIEINAGIAEATAIPWELIRDPRLNAPSRSRRRHSSAGSAGQSPLSCRKGGKPITCASCSPSAGREAARTCRSVPWPAGWRRG